MLRRLVVAGPSRALLVRQSSTAAARVADSPAAFSTEAGPDPVSTQSAHSTDRLLKIAAKPTGSQSRDERNAAWKIYRSLAPVERSRLSTPQLRAILRALVPRYDEAWQIARGEGTEPDELRNLHRDNIRRAANTAARLRSVMQELVARDEGNLNDWLLCLNALGRLGHLSVIESLVRDMPENLRDNRLVQQARLGAIDRWSRGLRSTGRKPEGDDIELAYNAFWSTFQRISTTNFDLNGLTLRLLLTAIASVSQLAALRGAAQPEAAQRLDGLFCYILQQAYGLDLKNLAVSVQARDAGGESRKGLANLSAKGLTAVMSHLIAMKTNPYRLVSIYEMLTKMPRVAYTQEEMYEEEEEEDDYYIAPEPVEGEAVSVEDGTRPESATSTPLSDSIIYQGPRYRQHFLRRPLLPAQVVALPPSEAVRFVYDKPTFSHETVTLVLDYLRDCEFPGQTAGRSKSSANRKLFHHFLECAIADVHEIRSRWLAVYLGVPEHRRPRLRRAARVSAEWFREAQARDSLDYGRGARSTVLLINRVLQWNNDEFAVIFEKEKSLRGKSDLQSIMEYPEWAKDPRARRIKHNLEVFIAAEELKSLALDNRKLKELLEKSKSVLGRRVERHRKGEERRAAREMEAETERLRSEALQHEKEEAS